jgi:hypothetical protein
MKRTTLFKSLSLATIYLTLSFLSACQQQSNGLTEGLTSESIIATYKTGEIKLQEVENYIVNLPVNKRWSKTQPENWLKEIINKIIVHKKLLEEAQLIAAEEDPKYKNLIHNISRDMYSQQYLANFVYDQSIREEDLLEFYNENIKRYVLPEKRHVYHIYKDKIKNNQAKSEIELLRNRIVAGENFKILAEQYSDSETRHKKGLLGVLKAGDMSKDFDSVVFSLKKNSPSGVINTADGYHLFLVSDILKAKKYQFSQVKNLIKQELIGKYAIESLKQKALLLPVPEPFILPSFTELKKIDLSKNPRKIILKVGEYQLSIGQYLNELKELRKKSKVKLKADIPEKYLQNVAYREIIYQHMLANDIPLNQEQQLQVKKHSTLVSGYIDTRIRAYLNNNTDIISQYYNKNRMRFATPITVNLQRLIIPRVESTNKLMSVLETSIKQLDEQKLTFEQMASKYHGKVQNLGWKSSAQLANIDTQILKYAFLLKEGEYSPPYTKAQFYVILKLMKRKNPIEQPLIKVRENVINEYIKNNSAEIFAEISTDLLKGVTINDAILAAFVNNQGSNI